MIGVCARSIRTAQCFDYPNLISGHIVAMFSRIDPGYEIIVYRIGFDSLGGELWLASPSTLKGKNNNITPSRERKESIYLMTSIYALACRTLRVDWQTYPQQHILVLQASPRMRYMLHP